MFDGTWGREGSEIRAEHESGRTNVEDSCTREVYSQRILYTKMDSSYPGVQNSRKNKIQGSLQATRKGLHMTCYKQTIRLIDDSL